MYLQRRKPWRSMDFVVPVLLTPICLPLILWCYVAIGIAWLVSFIPVVGPWFFVLVLGAHAPFMGICQVYGLCWVEVGRQVLDCGTERLTIRSRWRSRSIPWTDIAAIRKPLTPLVEGPTLILRSGRKLRLNPFTENDELLRKAQRQGIPSLGWDGSSS